MNRNILLALAAACPFFVEAEPSRASRSYGPWTSARLGGGGYLQHAAISKTDPARIYLATDVGGCYRTDDGGQSWRMLHGELPPGEASYQVRGILAHPTQHDTLLIATGSKWEPPRGIYRSDDAGSSFQRVRTARFEGNDDTRADGFILVGHPTQPDTVFAAPIDEGPLRSDDFGRSWRSLGLTGVYPRDFVVDSRNPDRLWLIADDRGHAHAGKTGSSAPYRHGLFLTENGGTSWTLLASSGIPREMIQDPVDPNTLHGLFRTAPQLRRSRDAGRTWQPYANSSKLPPPNGARSDGTYAAIAAGPDFIIVGGHGGTFYRQDVGTDAWRRLPAPSVYEGDWYAALTQPVERHFGSSLGFIAVAPTQPSTWLFTDWYACYRSPDAGSTWHLAIEGIEMAVVHCVAQDPVHPDRIHAGMADIGYFRSDDGGTSLGKWGRHRGISNNIKHIAVCASQPSRLYAVGPQTWLWHANQTFRSDDGGDSWHRPAQRGLPPMPDATGARCNTIAVHPNNPDAVCLVLSGPVGAGQGGVYQSLNAGDDWTWLGEGLPKDTALFRQDIWVSGPELAVSANGTMVAMSNDTGRGFHFNPDTRRWHETKLPAASHCVVADPHTPGQFYAALREAGAFRSQDGGITWSRIAEGDATSITVDAAVPNRLAVSDGSTFCVSRNGGASWKTLAPGLPFRHGRNVISFAGERLVVGTGGSGVFSAPLP